MKKVLIGCGILVLVLGISGAIGAYYFVWRPAKAYVAEFAKLKEIPQLNQQVRNTTSFAAPTDNVLTTESVDRFVRTQQTIQTTLGAKLEELRTKYRTLGEGLSANRKPSWSEVTGAYKDLAGLIVEAKRAQVDALNQNNFSLAEYDWTRRRVYEAAGIPLNGDFEKILSDISAGNKPSENNSSTPPPESAAVVPEKNRTLVSPHAKELGERAVLAAFGL